MNWTKNLPRIVGVLGFIVVGLVGTAPAAVRAQKTVTVHDASPALSTANSFYADGNSIDTCQAISVPTIRTTSITGGLAGTAAEAKPDSGTMYVRATAVTGDSGNTTLALDVVKYINGNRMVVATISSFLTMYLSDALSVCSAGTDTLAATGGTYGVFVRQLPWATVFKWNPDELVLRSTAQDAASDSVQIPDIHTEFYLRN